MKTNQIAMMLLAGAALMLSSCDNREKEFEELNLAEDEVAFKIGSVQTRSLATDQEEVLQLGSFKTNGDDTFILQETITSLDAASNDLATRGTPAFTENVKDLYGTFYTVALDKDGKAAFTKKGSDIVNGVEYTYEKDNEEGQGIWHYHYGENIWANLPTYFFMRMPGKNDGVTLGSAPYSISDGSISFSYQSPTSAASQKDILFASYKREEETNAEKVTFYHALTGVKFANYFDNKLKEGATSTVKTIIKSVTISGIKSKGDCKLTPSAGSSAEAAVWSNVTTKADFTITAGAAPNDTTNYSGSSYQLDELLDADAKARNINDKDGSLTFWFIPQDLKKVAKQDSVTLTVVFDIELDGETTFSNKELTVTLSDKLADGHKVWKAGELHTFTLRPTAVDVEIDDKLDNFVKSKVVIENRGNVYQYVRVNLIGNWWGYLWKEDKNGQPVYEKDSTIVFGYMWDSNHENPDSLTNGWNDKDFTKINTDGTLVYKDGYEPYGTFVNLPIKSTTSDPVVNDHKWVRFDKYYYYTEPIGPGSSVTNTLFDSYEVGPSPEFWIPDVFGVRHKAGNVHLLMDLMVQAIEAPMKEDGTEALGENAYMKAWAAALGVSISDLDDLKVNQ